MATSSKHLPLLQSQLPKLIGVTKYWRLIYQIVCHLSCASVACKPVTIYAHHVVSLFQSHTTIMIKISPVSDGNKE